MNRDLKQQESAMARVLLVGADPCLEIEQEAA
jgi:hypothetical protein